MNKELTEMVFIIDRSGSMCGMEEDTVGGFNSTIRRQKEEKGECLVSTVLFNSISEVIFDRVDIKKIRDMEKRDYIPSGCTALVDALGDSIRHIRNVHKYIREEDRPSKTVFVITTDGLENASHKYTSDEVKEMVNAQKEKGWEFIYLAANIDAVSTASNIGIDSHHAANFINDSKGHKARCASVNEALSSIRVYGKMSETWACAAEEDFKERK